MLDGEVEALTRKLIDKALEGDSAALARLAAPMAAGGHVMARRPEARFVVAAAALETERTRADKAVAAFAGLADRFAVLVEERSRPWWKRLTRTA